ncbi:MAG: hypothetical protein HOV87_18270 [Catenulispora sp.]|nr:hypothetical protein [Catenulispora sp.]
MTTPVPTASQQLATPGDHVLHSANAGAVIWRQAQIAAGAGDEARIAVREQADHLNGKHGDLATVFVYEEAFGTRGRVHVMINVHSLSDYHRLVTLGPGRADARNGVFGRMADGAADRLFVAGSVRETVLLPHRWGMFGTATEAMAQDSAASPLAPGDGLPRFEVQGAQAQTTLPPERTVHSANAGVIMHRSAEASYEFRAEARVFARFVAENNNLNMEGQSTVFLYEEAFGHMDRLHMLIHMRSLDVFYLMMGFEARTDPDAPRASFIRDWISMDKGGGAWDRILMQGTTQDNLLAPVVW